MNAEVTMTILYLLKADQDETLQEILSVHSGSNDVSVFDIRGRSDYTHLIEKIELCDKVISW